MGMTNVSTITQTEYYVICQYLTLLEDLSMCTHVLKVVSRCQTPPLAVRRSEIVQQLVQLQYNLSSQKYFYSSSGSSYIFYLSLHAALLPQKFTLWLTF